MPLGVDNGPPRLYRIEQTCRQCLCGWQGFEVIAILVNEYRGCVVMQNRYQKVMSFFGQALNNSSERSEQSAVIVLDCLSNIEVFFPTSYTSIPYFNKQAIMLLRIHTKFISSSNTKVNYDKKQVKRR